MAIKRTKKKRHTIADLQLSLESVERALTALSLSFSFADLKDLSSRLKSCEIATNQTRNVLEGIQVILAGYDPALGFGVKPADPTFDFGKSPVLKDKEKENSWFKRFRNINL